MNINLDFFTLKQNRKIILYGGAVILVLATIIVALAILNRLPVSVQLTSQPTPIDVFIDNQSYQTPATIQLTPGTHTIWGAKTGYLIYSKNFKVSRFNHQLEIPLQVDPQADYPPEGAPK